MVLSGPFRAESWPFCLPHAALLGSLGLASELGVEEGERRYCWVFPGLRGLVGSCFPLSRNILECLSHGPHLPLCLISLCISGQYSWSMSRTPLFSSGKQGSSWVVLSPDFDGPWDSRVAQSSCSASWWHISLSQPQVESQPSQFPTSGLSSDPPSKLLFRAERNPFFLVSLKNGDYC